MRLTHVSGVASPHHVWRRHTYVAPAKRGRRVAIGARPGRAAPNESIMNPRQTQEQIGLFPALPTPAAAQVDAIRAQAAQARDAALAALLGRAARAVGRTLATIAQTLVTWPQRRAAYESLRRLGDRELADIGLTRADIARVFDPDFTVPARAANVNQAAAAARTQVA